LKPTLVDLRDDPSDLVTVSIPLPLRIKFGARFAKGNAAPSARTNLVATAGNKQVSLTWDTAAGVTWNVYRGTTPGGESATAITTGLSSASYTDTGRTNGTTYYYTVKAVKGAVLSAASNEANAAPGIRRRAGGAGAAGAETSALS
jgi:hypothetical protein